MNVICAEEAREIADYGIVENKLLQHFFDNVRAGASMGKYTIVFIPPERDFSEDELHYLIEALKFTIKWNSACLWYEIRW